MGFTTRAALAVLAAALAPLSAHAAESFDNCKGFIDTLPATIATQGVWCLRKDLATNISTGAAITVATNNVTIDCNGYKLGGLAAGASTDATGIETDAQDNITVRGCSIRGFDVGVYLGGSGQLVERNRFDANTVIGVAVNGDGNIVRDNIIRDTGGRPDEDTAHGILALGESPRIIANQIQGVSPTGDATGRKYPTGILADGRAVIASGNHVSGLVWGGDGQAMGIRAIEGAVSHNILVQPSGSVGRGIAGFAPVVCHGNIIKGYSIPEQGCSAGTNLVQP